MIGGPAWPLAEANKVAISLLEAVDKKS